MHFTINFPINIPSQMLINPSMINKPMGISNISSISIPNIPLPKIPLPNIYCNMIKTPDNKLFNNAPFIYDINFPKIQPIDLIVFKSMYNELASKIFDGTTGIHPISSLIQHETLKKLDERITSFCL